MLLKHHSNAAMTMTRTMISRLLPALLFFAASTIAGIAQSTTSAASSPMPKDPAALLALAAQHNGLTGPNLKPWHIRATYQLYDAKGNPTEKGTFEEWWNSAKEYKLTFGRPSYHMQLVVNAKGTFVSGDEAIPYPESVVHRILVDPVSTTLPDKEMKLHTNREDFGKATLDCVEEIPKGLGPTGIHSINQVFPTYCMEMSRPLLRVYGSFGQGLTELTSIASLDGRYLAQDALFYDNGHKLLSIHLDQGESTSRWDPSFFIAPPGANLEPNYPKNVTKSAKVIAGLKVGGKDPTYPDSAKLQHQQGKVEIAATIGKDGHLHNLVVIAAPCMSLADSALGAVKTWTYRPYLVNGHPTNVSTTITVTYTLG